mgnify:CR=1 FL=1
MRTRLKDMSKPEFLPCIRGRASLKTFQDLVIYSDIIAMEHPLAIVEFGSATGASAIYLAETSKLISISASVVSYDIIDVEPYEGITFIKQDLSDQQVFDWEEGKKLVIEDSHVPGLLLEIDKYLSKGDILVVEDLDLVEGKRQLFNDFIIQSKNEYEDATEYLEIFGEHRDSTCDAILRVL